MCGGIFCILASRYYVRGRKPLNNSGQATKIGTHPTPRPKSVVWRLTTDVVETANYVNASQSFKQAL